MAKGQRDTSSLVVLTGWDAGELSNFQLQDGTTYAAVVAQVNAALGALNAELANDPLWASLISFSDQLETEYRSGVSNGMQRHTEYGKPDAQRAETIGHMIPFIPWDRMLGWTWDYLRKARLSQIQADIADALKDVRDRWRVSILTRLLKRGDDSGALNGLGTTGYSPGFATAASATAVDFAPPSNEGTVFDSNHEHYVGIAGGVYTNAVFQDAKDEIREHGHDGMFTFLIGPSDRATVEGLSLFTKAASQGVRVGSTQDVAISNQTVNSPKAVFIGTIEDFEVYEVRGIPQYYGVGYKTYGPRSQRNPLRIRVAKGATAPSVIAMPDPKAGNGQSPLQNLMLFTEFGVGVQDRTAATPRYVNSATWSDGTPT